MGAWVDSLNHWLTSQSWLWQEQLEAMPWQSLEQALSLFVFYYPLVMAYIWMIGGSLYYFRREWQNPLALDATPELPDYPPVSILIPCYNESENIRETISHLLHQNYPHYEIIAINDGSKDNTLAILQELAAQHPQVRVVNLASNQGKAVGLRTAALLANSEYLVCIDGDALLADNAVAWMLRHFLSNPKVGAVTGNPRIRNRSTLLGKIQVGEFSAIVGMIKRAQRSYGRIFTISGVIAAFRKSALHEVGYWSPDMITEDIDISWKLQLAGWQIPFETQALCWVLMPETLNGLWRQRSRWAQGGVEVLMRYFSSLFNRRALPMWPLYLECCISLLWSLTVLLLILLAPLHVWLDNPQAMLGDLSPSWTSMLLSLTCLLQFAVSLSIDARYEQQSGGRYYYWIIWYPIVYWLINIGTAVNGFIKAVRKKRGQRAVWVTLDRGLKDHAKTHHQ